MFVTSVDVARMVESIAVEIGVEVRAPCFDGFEYRFGIPSQLIFAGVAPTKVYSFHFFHTPDVCFGVEKVFRMAMLLQFKGFGKIFVAQIE